MSGNGYALTETDRRLANIVTIGTVKAVDAANGLLQVDLDGPESEWIPWTVSRAGGDRSWWAPEVGEQVVVAAPSGDLGGAVVLGSLYQDDYPEPATSLDVHRIIYSDGTIVEYDRAAHQLLANLGASKIQASRTEIVLQVGSAKISITSSGIAITGGTLTHNGKNVGEAHTHSGVEPGSASSGPPV